MAHRRVRFRLRLSHDQYMAYYRGVVQTVTVVADDGCRIAFPAGNIRRYLTETGIQGCFEMELKAENKFVGIRKR